LTEKAAARKIQSLFKHSIHKVLKMKSRTFWAFFDLFGSIWPLFRLFGLLDLGLAYWSWLGLLAFWAYVWHFSQCFAFLDFGPWFGLFAIFALLTFVWPFGT
jgi:hypothetical protein